MLFFDTLIDFIGNTYLITSRLPGVFQWAIPVFLGIWIARLVMELF